MLYPDSLRVLKSRIRDGRRCVCSWVTHSPLAVKPWWGCKVFSGPRVCSSGHLLCEEEGLPCPLPLSLLWRERVSIVVGVPDICSDCNGFVVSLLSYCILIPCAGAWEEVRDEKGFVVSLLSHCILIPYRLRSAVLKLLMWYWTCWKRTLFVIVQVFSWVLLEFIRCTCTSNEEKWCECSLCLVGVTS